MKTPFNTCLDCGSHNDPNEICECKKTAPGAVTPRAETMANAKNIITDSLHESPQAVNSDFTQEFRALYSQLSPEGEDRVFRFAKLYSFDPDFSAAFDSRFGNIEKQDYQELCKFIDNWKAVTA